jgi:hypothetical protein
MLADDPASRSQHAQILRAPVLKFAQRNQTDGAFKMRAQKYCPCVFSENQQSSRHPASLQRGVSRTSRT